MANETLLRDNLEADTIDGSLTALDTSITFANAPGWATLNSGNAVNQYRRIRIESEIIYVTAYTAAATTATISRGKEGTTAVVHNDGVVWEEPPAAEDFAAPTTGINWAAEPVAETNWDTYDAVNGTVDSDGTQNDLIDWKVPLQKGTYTLALVHELGADAGIYTITLAGLSLSSDLSGSADTIDGYHVSSTNLQRDTITGIVVPTDGLWLLNTTMATKNGSSSSYVGRINQIQLTRTA